MLYLEPPFFFINGVSVYRDHADPLQYYFLAAQPRLRTSKDGAGRDVPRLQLIKYRSLVAGKGGFLTFDVDLGLTDAERDDIASEVRRLQRLPALPRVAPVPLLDGTVRLLIMGQDSAAAATPPRPGAPPPPAAPPRFVVKAQHFAKPALFGANAAAFSVELDPQGTAIMEAALKGEIAPMVVVYSLDFAALRPAFSVRLSIDWNRVQSQLDETFGHEGFFTSTEISSAVDKLIENRAIVMEADNLVPDADDAGKGVAERFESARMRVQEMISDSFFEASIPPNRERPDGWDKAADIIGDMSRHAGMMATTGGIGGIIGTFSYKKASYERIDKRKLDVEISERSAVVRTVHPQGTVTGLVRQIEQGVDLKRFILEVNADDPFFEERRVRVINRGEMERDELVSVNVELTYGARTRSANLTKANEERDLNWDSVLKNGAISKPVSYQYEVAFKPDAGGERPLSAKSPTLAIEGDVVEVQPAELYSRVTVPITVSPSYPWAKYPQVQVRLRYADPAHGIRTDDTLLVAKDDLAKSFTFIALDKSKRDFEYRLLHRAVDNEDVDSGWITSDADLVDILDPFGKRRLVIKVAPVVPRWDDIEQIFVDLEYSDDKNGVHETASLSFSPEQTAPQDFVIDRQNVHHKLVHFSATILFKGGLVSEIPRSATEEPRILIRPDMRGHRIVGVAPPDMVRAKLDRIDAELRYHDAANGIDVADRMSFDGQTARRTFEFDYVDPARHAFEWRASYVFTNGMVQQLDWAEAEGDEFVVPAP